LKTSKGRVAVSEIFGVGGRSKQRPYERRWGAGRERRWGRGENGNGDWGENGNGDWGENGNEVRGRQ